MKEIEEILQENNPMQINNWQYRNKAKAITEHIKAEKIVLLDRLIEKIGNLRDGRSLNHYMAGEDSGFGTAVDIIEDSKKEVGDE